MAIRNLDKLDEALQKITNGYWNVDSDSGNIFSHGAKIGFKNGRGYKVVSVSPGRKVLVHIIIWTFVHGLIPQGMEINHKDGNKFNSRIDNLELVTPKQNSQHGHDMGFSFRWGKGKSPQCKVNWENVKEIRRLSDLGISRAAVSKKFGIAPNTVSNIVNYKRWRYEDGI